MSSAPFTSGERVFLRGLEPGDAEPMAAWLNDPDVTRLLFMGWRPVTPDALRSDWAAAGASQNEIPFAVCLREDERFIGTTGLHSINWIMRSTEFRIHLGDKTVWNQGLGTETTSLLVAYAFDKLNLNRVWLGVNAANDGGVRAYEKAGFSREGILREEQYRNGRYYDVIRMSILRNEYQELRGEPGPA